MALEAAETLALFFRNAEYEVTKKPPHASPTDGCAGGFFVMRPARLRKNKANAGNGLGGKTGLFRFFRLRGCSPLGGRGRSLGAGEGDAVTGPADAPS